MINSFVTGDDAVVVHFRRVPHAVENELRQTIGRETLRLQRKVVAERLSGQVLKVRTGTLRRSIDQVVMTPADEIVGIVSTNVKYGKAHEYGYSGAVAVKDHLRLVKQAFGKALKMPVYANVKGHSRNVNLPERSFLRSALRELGPVIRQALANAVRVGTKA